MTDRITRIYLDNCCFNRPFDDQTQLRIKLETEAKLKVQDDIRTGLLELVWSYILDYENNKNPFQERREQIDKWRNYASLDITEEPQILDLAIQLRQRGLKKIDALHIACAIYSGANYFLTTDDGILKKIKHVDQLVITDPIGFIKEVLI